MEQRKNTVMEAEDIMRDCLDTLKFLADSYTKAVTECDSQDLRGVLRNILNDKIELQAATFQFMHQRKWYQPAPAKTEEIAQLTQHFRQQYEEVMSIYQ